MDSDRLISIPSLILFGCIAAIVVFLGASIQVDYSDSYHLFNNARAIIERLPNYSVDRFIGASLLMVPAFGIEKITGMSGLGFRLVHLQASAFYLVYLVTAYLLFKQILTRKEALGGLCLLLITPILFHYAPFAKEDIPGSVFFSLGILLYLKPLTRIRECLIAVAFAWAMGCRYNLLPLVLALIFYDLKRWKTLLGSVLIFFCFPIILYPWLGRATFYEAPGLFMREMLTQFSTNFTGYKPWWVNLSFFYHSFPIIMLIFGILGMFFAFRSSEKRIRFHSMLFVIFFAYQSFIIPGKEMRYLFPVLPVFIILVMYGLGALVEKFRSKWLQAFFWIGMCLQLFAGIREVYRFSDPFYRTNFAKQLSLSASELGEQIYWLGNYYGLRPRVFHFDLLDDFAYLYHLHHHVIQFYTGQTIRVLPGRELLLRDGGKNGYWVPGIGSILEDKSVLLISTETQDNVTRTISEPLAPFVVQRLRKHHFSKPEGIPLPDGEYELYVSGKSAAPTVLTKGVLSNFPKPKADFALVYFDQIRIITPPH